jgi:hypothetical protein
MPNVDILAKKAYCKWHDSYTHTTNECNYFWRQVQSAINNGRLTLGDGGKMKLNIDRFLIGMVELMDKKILLRMDQAETAKGKNIMTVGFWPCKVSSEIHVNGRHVSEPIWRDKGKKTVPESEDEKDAKRTHMVLSKGREVVGTGYSRLSGMLQESRIEEESQITLTRLVGFAENTTQIGGQIGLLRAAGVIEMAARVNRQIGLLRSAGVMETATQSLETRAGLTGLATRSRKQEVPVGLLTQKAELHKIRLTRKAGLRKI